MIFKNWKIVIFITILISVKIYMYKHESLWSNREYSKIESFHTKFPLFTVLFVWNADSDKSMKFNYSIKCS